MDNIKSDEGPTLETLYFTIHIGSTPTFLYFEFVFQHCPRKQTMFIAPRSTLKDQKFPSSACPQTPIDVSRASSHTPHTPPTSKILDLPLSTL